MKFSQGALATLLFILNALILFTNSQAGTIPMYRQTTQVQLSPGLKTEATLLIPTKLKPGEKVPGVMIFGGFESAARVLELIQPETPVVLASFDYPYSAPRVFKFPDSLKTAPEAKLLFPRTLDGIHSLVDELLRRPEVDPNRILIVGASFGAPFAVAAAERDPRIRDIALLHGFGKIPETVEHVIDRSWSRKFGVWARPLAWLSSRLGWIYLNLDPPENSARKLRPDQNVLMITALEDSFIPRESSDSLWNAISSSRTRHSRILMQGDHLMPGSEALIRELMRKVQAWLLTVGC
jgi:dienelactone hydrolase